MDVEDPQLYDVILNTSSAPLDTLAAVVIDLAHAVASWLWIVFSLGGFL